MTMLLAKEEASQSRVENASSATCCGGNSTDEMQGLLKKAAIKRGEYGADTC
jgi:hypothetical protein